MANVNEVLSEPKPEDFVLKGNSLGSIFHLSHVNYLKAACSCDTLLYPDISAFLMSHQNQKSDRNHFQFPAFESQWMAFGWWQLNNFIMYLLTDLDVVLIISLFELWFKNILLSLRKIAVLEESPDIKTGACRDAGWHSNSKPLCLLLTVY